MVRVITTQNGQFLADVKSDEGFTLILDSKSFTPVARINSIDRAVIMSNLRKLENVMKKKSQLEKSGVVLLSKFEFKEVKQPAPIVAAFGPTEAPKATIEVKSYIRRRKNVVAQSA